jgi:hypothetical protein
MPLNLFPNYYFGGSLPQPLPNVVSVGFIALDSCCSAASFAFASADKVTVSAVEGAVVVVVLA